MTERRTAERLIVPPDSLQRVAMHEDPDPAQEPAEEQTQPMRLSFLALLVEKDPAVPPYLVSPPGVISIARPAGLWTGARCSRTQ